MDDRSYSYLKRQLAELLDIDLDAYKTKQMRRRLEAFVRDHAGDEPMPFIRGLRDDATMLQTLREMLTINVTEFFRDALQFETLQSKVLPELLERVARPQIWSAACSLGHEPYSVAIILDELGAGSRARILATDIDRAALTRAKAGGPYPESEMRNVSRPRLKHWFERAEDGYMINRDLVRRVTFKEGNLLTDKPRTGFDLILCRNVMIYFAGDAKAALVRRLHGALSVGGVLFVGATEALMGAEGKDFQRLGGNFYRKQPSALPQRQAA